MPNSVTIMLTQIKCNNTSEHGHDEVYIKYSIDGQRDKRYPSKGYQSLANGEIWSNINLPISYKNTVVIGLYDSDAGKDDFLGSHTYQTDDASQAEQHVVSNSNGANYTLYTEPA